MVPGRFFVFNSLLAGFPFVFVFLPLTPRENVFAPGDEEALMTCENY